MFIHLSEYKFLAVNSRCEQHNDSLYRSAFISLTAVIRSTIKLLTFSIKGQFNLEVYILHCCDKNLIGATQMFSVLFERLLKVMLVGNIVFITAVEDKH